MQDVATTMAIEIERKFLVVGEDWRAQAHKVVPMAQGYLNDQATVDTGSMHASIRVRIADHQGYLNLKSRELGRSRQEFDYPIPADDARALMALCVGGVIDKRRHYIDHAGHLWEVDEFIGDNAGLVVAEIELSSVDEGFERPHWLGVEATDAPRYYNLALASRAYAQWREDERLAVDLQQAGSRGSGPKETN